MSEVDTSGVVVTTPAPTTEQANRATLEAALTQLLADAAQAQATLQGIRDAAQVSFTTIGQAQTVVRGIQGAVQDVARIEQEHIKRTVALARLVVGALDSTSGA